jgi:hypothetical protein
VLATSVAALVPAAVGAKRTLIEHTPPAAMILPLQLSFEVANCIASVPLSETVIVPVEEPPVFFATNVTSDDVMPGASAPKSFVAGVSSSAPGSTTLATSGTVTAPPGVASTSRAAARLPVEAASTTIVTAHDSAACRTWFSQPSWLIENCDAATPASVALANSPVATSPVLVNVMLAGALDLPVMTVPKSYSRMTVAPRWRRRRRVPHRRRPGSDRPVRYMRPRTR